MKAIGHFNGPCLTLAGPGSGKTAVITERTKNLITKYHVNPSNILVITFTKAAALEMKTRFLSLMGNGSYPVTFGTFHAVYFSILKHAYNYNANNIVREEQKYALMRELVQKHRLEYEDETEFVSSILGEISMVKIQESPSNITIPRTVLKIYFEEFMENIMNICISIN